MDPATASLVGVGIGAAASLLGSAGVPWIRDSFDRKRRAREQLLNERRSWLMSALSALLEISARQGDSRSDGAERAKFGAAVNELTLRLAEEDQPILEVLMAMFTLTQQGSAPGLSVVLSEAMAVLTLWARGDIAVDEVKAEVETRAGLEVVSGHIRVQPRTGPPAP